MAGTGIYEYFIFHNVQPNFRAIAEWALCVTQQLDFFPHAQSDDKPLSHLNAERVG
jgi:hypothetical protein